MPIRRVLCVSCIVIVFSSGVIVSAEKSPRRKGYPGGIIHLPVGELKLGDVTCWTKSGLTSGVALWEGNPNEAEGNWNVIRISLEAGAKMEAKRLQTNRSANFVTLIDVTQQKVWWVPFQDISSIKAAKTEVMEVPNVSRTEEIFRRFYFLSTPVKVEDFQASLEITLLHQAPAGGEVREGCYGRHTSDL